MRVDNDIGNLTEDQLYKLSTNRLINVLRRSQVSIGHARYEYFDLGKISRETYNSIVRYHNMLKRILSTRDHVVRAGKPA